MRLRVASGYSAVVIDTNPRAPPVAAFAWAGVAGTSGAVSIPIRTHRYPAVACSKSGWSSQLDLTSVPSPDARPPLSDDITGAQYVGSKDSSYLRLSVKYGLASKCHHFFFFWFFGLFWPASEL